MDVLASLMDVRIRLWEPLVGARTVTISDIRSSVSHYERAGFADRAPHSVLGRAKRRKCRHASRRCMRRYRRVGLE